MDGRAFRLAVDVGGTFTDVICHDIGTGSLLVGKTPTDRDDPAGGVLRALAKTLDGVPLAGASDFSHGTTAGLNAILERRGAVTGLLCTSGFRDVLEIRRGSREDAFDLVWKPPAPLVPRRLRRVVRERMRADGSVHMQMVDADVLDALTIFETSGVESVAIAFINSWANPEHERRACDILRGAGFEGEITMSHELSREYREYERTSTAAVNAYIRPAVAHYIGQLDEGLSASGFDGRFSVMRSGGGTMPAGEAERRPFEAVFSGPVAGAEAAARVAKELGARIAVAADVGGTSFDATLLVDGRPTVLPEGSVAGFPVQSTWVDVRSIGAGGGSIARVDPGGLLRVGPESAGSRPGPASYGGGGTAATVTDAAAFLGMLGEGRLGDELALDLELANRALTPLAEQLNLSVRDLARGVVVVSASAMADAIREITVERGHDPREATLVAFGGAGPLFATLLAVELNIGRIAIPPHAGNFSAWGLLGADETRERAMTFMRLLSPAALVEADVVVAELLASIEVEVGEHTTLAREALVDVRYRGQEHSLTVLLPDGAVDLDARVDELARAFGKKYRSLYLHELNHELELIALRVSVREASGLREWMPLLVRSAGRSSHEAYSFTSGELVGFDVVERASLALGQALRGPAIIVEPTTTTYLDAGFVADVHDSGLLLVTPDGARPQ
jgi:N-methylhydantoinase A